MCGCIMGCMSIVENGSSHIMGMPMRCMKCIDGLDLQMQGLTAKQQEMAEIALAEWRAFNGT